MAGAPTKYRVQFDFVEEAYEELNELQEKLRAPTKAEVVRYGIRILQWVVANMEEENQILVDDGDTQKEVIFPFIPVLDVAKKKKRSKSDAVLTP